MAGSNTFLKCPQIVGVFQEAENSYLFQCFHEKICCNYKIEQNMSEQDNLSQFNDFIFLHKMALTYQKFACLDLNSDRPIIPKIFFFIYSF